MKKHSVFSSSKWSKKANKLAVLIPCRDTLFAAHALSVIELIKYNTMNDIDTHVIMDASTVLLTQRQNLAQAALDINADYILWLDSDIVCPSTTALRLLNHNEPIVCGNYVRRQVPHKGVAYRTIGDWENPLPFEVQDNLVPIEGIGMGCMLMKTSILKEIEKPYFDFTWTPISNDWLGEDIYFCQKITNAGYTIKVDTMLSQELYHLGTYAFSSKDLKEIK